MRERHDHAARLEVLAFAHLGDGLDEAGRNAGAFELLDPLGGRPRSEDLVQQRHERVAVPDALGLGVEAWVGRELGMPERGTALGPQRVVRDAQHDERVGGAEHFVGHDRRMGVAATGRARAGAEVDAGLIGEQRGHDVEHRDLDLLTTTGPGPGEERQHDAMGRRHAGDQIGDRVADFHRRAIRETGEVHDARLGLDHEVVARAVRLGARLAESRHRAVHQARVQTRERTVPETELVHRPRSEVLEQHVALLRQLPEDLAPLRRLEVQGDALLAPVHRHEVRRLAPDERRPAARVIALAGLLDLDHLGAHVAEHHRAEGAREDAGEVEHANASQRSLSFRHGVVLSTRASRGSARSRSCARRRDQCGARTAAPGRARRGVRSSRCCRPPRWPPTSRS